MKTKLMLFAVISLFVLSCGSTKSTLKNVDDNAPIPKLSSQNTFVITEYSKDKKYGYVNTNGKLTVPLDYNYGLAFS